MLSGRSESKEWFERYNDQNVGLQEFARRRKGFTQPSCALASLLVGLMPANAALYIQAMSKSIYVQLDATNRPQEKQNSLIAVNTFYSMSLNLKTCLPSAVDTLSDPA